MSDPERDAVRRHLEASAEVTRRSAGTVAEAVLAAAGLLADTFRAGGKALLCGNGGSAADCQHLAAEFVGRLTRTVDRPGFAAIALTTDTSFLTAYANDCGFDDIFARQVATLGRPGDVLIAISTSGESENVLRAVAAARSAGLRTIGLSGQGGRLPDAVDVAIRVPSGDTQHIQETHVAIEHTICGLVERTLVSARAQAGGPDR